MTAAGRSFYHDVSLRGPVPERLLFRPKDPSGPDAVLAERLGHIAERRPEAFFSAESPSFAYAQSFAWLPCLAHAPQGREIAAVLFAAFMREHGRYTPQSWAPRLAAVRTESMLRGAALLLDDRDAPFREQVLGTAIRQLRHLGRRIRRAGAERQRPGVLAAVALGGLCLPHAADQERAARDPLATALLSLVGGELPERLRDPAAAARLGLTLTLLSQAYAARGLTPPAGLSQAISLLRLLLGASLVDDGGVAVLPGRQEGDRAALAALSPVIRPESAAAAARLGLYGAASGPIRLHVEGGTRSDARFAGAFCLTDGADRIVTAAGLPGEGQRAADPWAERWADALDQPAAAATLDLSGFGPAAVEAEDGAEGMLFSITRKGAGKSHSRRLFLAADGSALLGEDRATPQPSVFRFPLHPTVETRGLADGRAILVLPSGRSWRFDGAGAGVKIDEGVYAGGGSVTKTRQIVLTAEREGVRWAFRKL